MTVLQRKRFHRLHTRFTRETRKDHLFKSRTTGNEHVGSEVAFWDFLFETRVEVSYRRFGQNIAWRAIVVDSLSKMVDIEVGSKSTPRNKRWICTCFRYAKQAHACKHNWELSEWLRKRKAVKNWFKL